MENVLAVSVDDSHTKLENYIDEKYGQVSIKYLKEKKLMRSNNNSPQIIKGIK